MYTVNGIGVDMLKSGAKHDHRHLYFYIAGPKTKGHLQRKLIIRRQVTRDNNSQVTYTRAGNSCD